MFYFRPGKNPDYPYRRFPVRFGSYHGNFGFKPIFGGYRYYSYSDDDRQADQFISQEDHSKILQIYERVRGQLRSQEEASSKA